MKYPRLWAACLALVPLAVCPALAQAPPNAPGPAAPALTGPVTKISIVGLKNISLDTVQAKMTLKVGDAYTVDAMSKEAAALHDLGVFQTVSVTSAPAPPNGVALTYTMTENPIVQSIHITANTPSGQPTIPAAELIAQMKTRTGQVLNTNILVKDLDNLFNHTTSYVFQKGFIFDVSSDINIDPKTGLLTIPLVEAYISSIETTGNSRIKTADILAQMHTKVGTLYDANILKNDLSALYETGEFRQINPYPINGTGPGKISITIPVVEQQAATGVLDEKQGKVIPFLYDMLTTPIPVVQVSINGHPPLPFVVDTGTTPPLLLAPWAAKELGLTPSSQVEKADNFTFSRAPIMSVVLQGVNHDSNTAFDIREAFVTNWSIINLAVPHPHIAGLVGIGALKSVTSRFDFAAKTLTIFTMPHPPLYIPGGTTLPLRSNNANVFTVHAVLAPDTTADLIVDTGSSDTQVPLSVLPALHPKMPISSELHETVDNTLYVCPTLPLANIMIGKAQVPNVSVGTLPATISQSLGMDILTRYRMTLDGPNGQLTLEPSAHGGHDDLGWAGLFVKQSGDGWAISRFEKGAPAQSAGLKLGDKVLTVNGIRVAGTQQLFCERLLGGLLGHRIQTTVQRGAGQLVDVSWTATTDSDTTPSPLGGLPMQKPLGGSWMVLEVIKNCPGDKAGLQAGDTLTQIDGEATATMSLDRFAELAKKPTVQVEVERLGSGVPFSVWLTASK